MKSYERLWFSVVAIASLWLLLGVLVPVSSSIQQRSRMSADQSRSLTSSAPPPPSAAAAVLSSSWSSSLTKKQNNNNNPVRKNQYSKNKSPKNNNNKMVARQNSKLECHPSQESIWLMNQCHHGYVAVLPDRRVVSLDANEPNNKLVEFSRESCRSPNSGPWDPIKTRLFSKSQQRYLCFNRRGRLRSVTPRRAELMGDYCAFYDRAGASPRHLKHAHPNPPTSYITLQSAQNPKWYMGFGPNTKRARRNLGLNFYRGNIPISLPRKMKRGRVHRHFQKKCDFRFVLGIFNPMTAENNNNNNIKTTKTESSRIKLRPESSSSNWDGLFKQIEASRHALVGSHQAKIMLTTNRNEVQDEDDDDINISNNFGGKTASTTDLNSNFGGSLGKISSSSSHSSVNHHNVRSKNKISQRASISLQQLLRRRRRQKNKQNHQKSRISDNSMP